MKILMVSIFAPHFFNWTEQLKDSGHEVYWLDVFDSKTKVAQLDFVHQVHGWRFKIDYPGRYSVKKNAPLINKFLNIFNERKLKKVFEEKLIEFRPDVVHTFVMYLATAPLLGVMKKYPNLTWIFSSWGSDLFYYSKIPKEKALMRASLPRINYLFTDCYRDYVIAKENGFRGKFLGVFPGGGGYEFEKMDRYIKTYEKKKLILIKGYQGLHGKCIQVLKSIRSLQNLLKEFEIVVFGASDEVFDFLKYSELNTWNNFSCFGKIPRQDVFDLMGKALIYIGNSSSDGLPNTLLEAIILGAFPIQSDPGGASSEIIRNGLNGLIIKDSLDIPEIEGIVKKAISGEFNLKAGIEYNFSYIKPGLERRGVRKKVLEKYSLLEKEINAKNISW